MTQVPIAYDPGAVRRHFPALARQIAGREAVFADGPGGTQVPSAVIAAMTAYLQQSNANFGGAFVTSRETTAMVQRARIAVAAFLHAAAPEEIVFGQNMTSLTFAISRALARTWQAGDEIVVTALDHDANVTPWAMAAADRGVMVKTLPFDPRDCSLSLAEFTKLLSPRTKLVALGYSSNAVGTISDLTPMIAAAHRVGALAFVDAVHYAAHGLVDVRALDCDLLACSAYKFCGPHLGIMYGKRELLESLTAYKVRPSSAQPPGKWETGTQNVEAIAGLLACIGFIGALSGAPAADPLARPALVDAVRRIEQHEHALSLRFLDGLRRVPGAQVYGITDPARIAQRTPTFGLTLAGCAPRQAAERLGERGIFVWDGHFYAKGLVEQLGLAESGGLIRVGFSLYNTVAEVDRVLDELRTLSG